MVKKLGAALGLKGILCIAALTIVALALVNYQTTLTITPIKQFTVGEVTDAWEIYVNDVDQVRYMQGDPGSPKGSLQPIATPDLNNGSTFAFHVLTDANKVCAVKIELTAPVNSSKFSKFEITVLRWNSTLAQWQSETLYAAATGSTPKSPAYIDGLTSGDAGYVHQEVSNTYFYLTKVTYSYDLVDATDDITVNFRYTPMPQDSF